MLDRYRHLRPIGRGSSATVYSAHDTVLDRWVALKVAHDVEGPSRRAFEREIHIAAQMADHPHFARVYEAGVTADTQPFLVMEWCREGSAKTQLERGGPLALADVLTIGIAIASALDALHHQTPQLHSR